MTRSKEKRKPTKTANDESSDNSKKCCNGQNVNKDNTIQEKMIVETTETGQRKQKLPMPLLTNKTAITNQTIEWWINEKERWQCDKDRTGKKDNISSLELLV